MTEDLEQAVAKAKETAAQRAKRLKQDVDTVLGTEAGRNVLGAILHISQVEVENMHDGPAAYRQEGVRYVGLRLIRMMRDASPEGYMKLYAEMHNGR